MTATNKLYVGLIRTTNLKKNVLTSQKQDVIELKLLRPVNMNGHRRKIILSPESVIL